MGIMLRIMPLAIRIAEAIFGRGQGDKKREAALGLVFAVVRMIDKNADTPENRARIGEGIDDLVGIMNDVGMILLPKSTVA